MAGSYEITSLDSCTTSTIALWSSLMSPSLIRDSQKKWVSFSIRYPRYLLIRGYCNKRQHRERRNQSLTLTQLGDDLLSVDEPWRGRYQNYMLGSSWEVQGSSDVTIRFGMHALRPGHLGKPACLEKKRKSLSDNTGKCFFIRSIDSKMTRLCSFMQFKHLCRESTCRVLLTAADQC